MDPRSADVLPGAVGLPGPDRAAIAQALLATLSPDAPDLDEDDEFTAELSRRLEESLRDPDATVSWSDLRAEG